jgi:hypothetical protein
VSGHCRDQRDRSDEHGHYFPGDRFGVDCVPETHVADAENEQYGQRRASVGEHERVHGCGDVVPPNREAFPEEPEEPRRGFAG